MIILVSSHRFFLCITKVTYPIPEISGTYLPQPSRGGSERQLAYIQITIKIFPAVGKVVILPFTGPKLKKFPNRQTDNAQSVNMETNPT